MNTEELTLRDITDKYGVKLAYLRDRFNIPLRTLQGWYYGQRTPPRYILEMMYTILEYNS